MKNYVPFQFLISNKNQHVRVSLENLNIIFILHVSLILKGIVQYLFHSSS